MTDYRGADELLARTRDFVAEHRDLYLGSGGRDGHIMDFTHAGAPGFRASLLLETIGRRTGRRSVVPLIYGCVGDAWVVVGSKGGAERHPAWYLNLRETAEVRFQVATQAFRATWREPAGDEHEAVWAHMARIFPPYDAYRAAVTGRTIPLVMLKPIAATAPIEGA